MYGEQGKFRYYKVDSKVQPATLPDSISWDTSPQKRLRYSFTLLPFQMLLVANVSMLS